MHEHLDRLGLIHMNGRLNDPLLARMIQADPIIQTVYGPDLLGFAPGASTLGQKMVLGSIGGGVSNSVASGGNLDATFTGALQSPTGYRLH